MRMLEDNHRDEEQEVMVVEVDQVFVKYHLFCQNIDNIITTKSCISKVVEHLQFALVRCELVLNDH